MDVNAVCHPGQHAITGRLWHPDVLSDSEPVHKPGWVCDTNTEWQPGFDAVTHGDSE